MLLTHGLWNRGNGTYRIYAFAFDVDNHFTVLGVKTIAVDNDRATRPFGAIDTPASGAIVSGTITNFGWALTPGSTCVVPSNGVQVWIDSGPPQTIAFGDQRPDVSAFLPGHTNTTAPGGHYRLDTTALSDGLHTIAWVVTDSCGRSEGIGSRYFVVANGR